MELLLESSLTGRIADPLTHPHAPVVARSEVIPPSFFPTVEATLLPQRPLSAEPSERSAHADLVCVDTPQDWRLFRWARLLFAAVCGATVLKVLFRCRSRM